IPYCMEINDIPLYIRKGYTGEQYYRSVMDQFEALLADSAKQPRVMGIPLHPMISGQPLRIKYLARALDEMKKQERVWFATVRGNNDAHLRANPTGGGGTDSQLYRGPPHPHPPPLLVGGQTEVSVPSMTANPKTRYLL